jgi:hypothetical protein
MAEAGETDEAKQHVAWLEKEVPEQLSRFIPAIAQRLARPEDRQRFIGSLRKAGLDGES